MAIAGVTVKETDSLLRILPFLISWFKIDFKHIDVKFISILLCR